MSKACQVMGLSRDTFYRYKAAVDESGVAALLDSNRRKPNLKNRIDQQVEQAIVDYATEQPAHGQVRASTSCASAGYSCRRPVFVVPGYGITSRVFVTGCGPWKQKSLLKALS